MASTFNKITIIGHLGRDPETRYLPSGDPVTSFSVATTERWKDRSGQQQERTTWFRVSAFGKLGETCSQFLHKGSYVYIEGGLSQQEYTDREGTQRQSLEVRAREMHMLDKRGEGNEFEGDFSAGGAGSAAPRTSMPAPAPAAAASLDDDDIPF